MEKAAGTTLIHVLRRNFLLRFMAVRPVNRGSPHFSEADLSACLRINPFLRCIAGHSIVPFRSLGRYDERIRYITQVREPVARAVSQFRFWNARMGKDFAADDFLKHHTAANLQTRKIAGSDDIEAAKQIISERFLLASAVDQFDEMLVLLADKLGIPLEMMVYSPQNQAASIRNDELPDGFIDRLREINEIDTALYQWIRKELFTDYVATYSGDLADSLSTFAEMCNNARCFTVRNSVDFVYRNTYVKPVSGTWRVINGLPYRGSYGSD